MNPILKDAVKGIKKHMNISESEEIFLISEISQAMSRVAYGCKTNPDFNLKGGKDADKNSYVPNINMDIFNWDTSTVCQD